MSWPCLYGHKCRCHVIGWTASVSNEPVKLINNMKLLKQTSTMDYVCWTVQTTSTELLYIGYSLGLQMTQQAQIFNNNRTMSVLMVACPCPCAPGRIFILTSLPLSIFSILWAACSVFVLVSRVLVGVRLQWSSYAGPASCGCHHGNVKLKIY